MGVAAVDQIGPGINGRTAQILLLLGGTEGMLRSPVGRIDDDIRPLLLQLPDPCHHGFGVYAIVDTAVQAHGHAVFQSEQLGLVGFHIGNPGLVQNPLGFGVALLPVVQGVVVGDGHRLHGAAGQDIGILSRPPEGISLSGRLTLVSQNALQVHHGEIVIFKPLANILEGIVVILPYGHQKAVACMGMNGVTAQGAVPGEGKDHPGFRRLGGVGGFLGNGLGHGDGSFRLERQSGILSRSGTAGEQQSQQSQTDQPLH